MKNFREKIRNADINTAAVITALIKESDNIRSARMLAQKADLPNHLTAESFFARRKDSNH